MSFFCYSKWCHSIGYGLAAEFAMSMGVTRAQIQLWNNQMKGKR